MKTNYYKVPCNDNSQEDSVEYPPKILIFTPFNRTFGKEKVRYLIKKILGDVNKSHLAKLSRRATIH